MLDHRDRVCVPIEVEMLPLYRDAYGDRLHRRRRRAARRLRRAAHRLALRDTLVRHLTPGPVE